MADFNLILDPVLDINENDSAVLTGTIENLGIQGSEVTLDIDWGDSNTETVSLIDGGAGDADGLQNGKIDFSLSHQYLDDNPTGTPSDIYNIAVDAQEQILTGTDAVFVIDVSGSTFSDSGIDVDGDGFTDTILKAEVAAFKALNQNLIDRGLGNTAKVSISAYESFASLLDLDPSASGVQTFTTPLADTDNNGIRDVDQALDSLTSGGGTNFEAGLQQAIQAIDNAGTPPGGGNVIFLSDGFGSGSFADEVNTITNTKGQNLRAFGVGSGSSLTQLSQIDPNAEEFTNIQDLLDLFDGTGANTNSDSESTSVTVNNVAPDLGVLNGLPASGTLLVGDALNLSASYTDQGTQDTHVVEIDWGDGTVDTENKAIGETNLGGSHAYTTPGIYTVTVTITDDDTLFDSDSFSLTVNDGGAPCGIVGTDSGELLEGDDNDNCISALGGNDKVVGLLGNDEIFGGAGNDSLRGDDDSRGSGTGKPGGNDVIFGDDGNDKIDGRSGNDVLLGGADDDKIFGGDGNDFLMGGAGNDLLRGDVPRVKRSRVGNDTFVLAEGEGTDTIFDFQDGRDKIALQGNLTFDDLTISQNRKNTVLGVAATGEELAILKNVKVNELTADDFIEGFATIDDVNDALALI